MQGPAHVGLSWLLGETARLEQRQDRRIVGLAGIAPDIDVLTYPLAYIAFGGDLDSAFTVYAAVHHRYTHGVLFVVLAALVAWRWSTPTCRIKVAVLTVCSVLLHIAGDIVASGNAWPVYPLAPFSDDAWIVAWSINASDWRNIVISIAAIAMTLIYARTKGYSPVECFSYRADTWLASVMRGERRSSVRFRLILYSGLLTLCVLVLAPLWLYNR
jgi:membrane-bound metal-dependent hydrolase YbcI (DUF457 family)